MSLKVKVCSGRRSGPDSRPGSQKVAKKVSCCSLKVFDRQKTENGRPEGTVLQQKEARSSEVVAAWYSELQSADG